MRRPTDNQGARTRALLAAAAACLLTITLPHSTSAAEPWPAEAWPAEAWTDATILTALDSDFRTNLSGAHWNPETRVLWVCLNGPGRFWALVEDGEGGFRVADQDGARGEWSISGDIEGITQVDPLEDAVYVINERSDHIQKYDVSVYGTATLLASWDISAHMPTADWAGSEGITFVPDDWLELAGFVDGAGASYTSVNGMGGLFFVAHQKDGGVYAFDVAPEGDTATLVGRYLTSRGESCGLEFDRSSGKLYIWHNTGANYLEMTDLTSTPEAGGADGSAEGTRRFTTVVEYQGARSGNLEGVALTPASSADSWCFLVDDDNQDGAALMWFQELDIVQVGHDRYTVEGGSTLAVEPPGVRWNDTGAAEGAVLLAEPAHGQLAGVAPGDSFDGSFTYTPVPGYSGFDSFTYKADDGIVDSAEATVVIEILPDPDPDPDPDPEFTLELRVVSSADDAEEAPDGSVNLTSSDLELVQEATQQIVGVRFVDVDIPRYARIRRAYLQFTVDEARADETALSIWGEASTTPAAFAAEAQNLSARSRTGATVPWTPPAWNTVGAAAEDQRTPDLSVILQEQVDDPTWQTGGALVFLIDGQGKRVAESWNGESTKAPLLRVEFDAPRPYFHPELRPEPAPLPKLLRLPISRFLRLLR